MLRQGQRPLDWSNFSIEKSFFIEHLPNKQNACSLCTVIVLVISESPLIIKQSSTPNLSVCLFAINSEGIVLNGPQASFHQKTERFIWKIKLYNLSRFCVNWIWLKYKDIIFERVGKVIISAFLAFIETISWLGVRADFSIAR